MSDQEKMAMVKSMLDVTDDSEDGKITSYLLASKKEIVAWRYSYASVSIEEQDVPSEYEMTQVMAVVAGYSQRGAENQLSHSENGISRTFKYADMLAYIRSNVITIARVI